MMYYLFKQSQASIVKEVLMQMSTTNPIYIQRIADASPFGEGVRVLIDRLWPRGFPRKKTQIDEWMKDIAPSAELQHWFAHIPERYPVFSAFYERELLEDPLHVEMLLRLKNYQTHSALILLYGSKNTEHNNAQVLLRVLQRICETSPHVYVHNNQTVRNN